MESLLHKIRYSYPTLGPAETKIADHILSHTSEVIGMTISELAARCECGDATVVRFARRLGLDGYGELKLRIAAELSASSKVSGVIEKSDNCYEIFQKRIDDITASLRHTEEILDEASLHRAARAVMNTDRIVIFGLGNSASIAQDAAHKFLRLGLSAQACCDNHMQAIIASHLKRGNVAIGISHSGHSKDIVEALALARACGATTVSITNFSSSPLMAVSDIVLHTKSEETSYSILGMSSRIAQLAILDSIYTYVVLNADKKAEQAIYNTEIALREKKFSE